MSIKVQVRGEIDPRMPIWSASPIKITQIYEGTNQVQRIVMARQLLKGLG